MDKQVMESQVMDAQVMDDQVMESQDISEERHNGSVSSVSSEDEFVFNPSMLRSSARERRRVFVEEKDISPISSNKRRKLK